MHVDVVHITDGAEEIIEYCARRCYRSQGNMHPGSSGPFVSKCILSGHLSVLRHAMATFELSGISRVCSHQLVRHKHLDYLQESQRYTKAETRWTGVEAANAEIGYMIDFYERLVESGVKREDARYCLPQAVHTSMVISGNLQAWYDFLRLRLSPKAQKEIRAVAQEIYRRLRLECPNIFNEKNLLHQPKITLDFGEKE